VTGPLTDYLATLPGPEREAFARVRRLAVAEAPDATEGTSYGMAALLLGGRPLLGLRAAKGHLSVFPFSPAVVEAVAGRLPGFDLSKGTIRFPAGTPLPDDVVRDLVRLRRAELEG
jgi:uncharacterized protein YdhG (YjbR/CyaY superfamily)